MRKIEKRITKQLSYDNAVAIRAFFKRKTTNSFKD